MRIALVTDAWSPQVNGVVRTLQTTMAKLATRGHDVHVIAPDAFRTIPCPSYPEIRLALGCGRAVRKRLDALLPDAIHIATEGPLGWAARRWCIDDERPFTTSFHTRFPDYLAMRTGMPARWFWPAIRAFHAPAKRVMVATDSLARELAQYGLRQTHRWSRGVDLALFSPTNAPHPQLADLPGPILLHVGRVAVEKNVEAFLAAHVPGTKVVVGDGPARAQLERAFPQAIFLGPLHGQALASAYAAADVLVFPSRTDTFGLVMIEALASGVPVAAFPVPGPLDVIGRDGGGRNGAPIGVLDEDLATAIRGALRVPRAACAIEAKRYSWDACTDQFFAGLARPDQRFRLAA
jgi:glycosyltransferase involved in cell wall biosynthesis